MKRLIVNLLSIFLHGTAFVLLFIPGMFYWEHWEQESWGIYSLSLRMNASFFHATGNISGFFEFLIVALLIVSAVWVFFDIFLTDRLNRLIKNELIIKCLNIALPSLVVVFLFIFMCRAKIEDSYGYKAPPNILFYVEMFVLGIIVFLGALKSFLRVFDKERTSSIQSKPCRQSEIIESSRSMDKLMEYKMMLDKGLINEVDYEKYKEIVLDQGVSNEWKADLVDDELPDL